MSLVVSCLVAGLGQTPATADSAQPHLSWTGPGNIGTGQPVLSVSCTSALFCAAVGEDTVGGSASVFDGHSWSTPVEADTADLLNTVSCVSQTFCVASDAAGNVTMFDGSQWSPASGIAAGFNITGLSCPATADCVAVSSHGGTYLFNGTSWGSGPSSGLAPVALSCATTTFCLELQWNGLSSIFNGSTWSSSEQVNSLAGSLTSVSCVSSSFCVAVDQGGTAHVFDGTGWTGSSIETTPPGTSLPTFSVSCVSSHFCAAVDSNGMRYEFNGTSWTPAVLLDPSKQLRSISCPAVNFCAAVDSSSGTFYENYGTWTTSDSIDTSPVRVSCVAASFCMGIDPAGNLFRYDGSTWSSTGSVYETSLSCTSTTFCLAMGNDTFQTYDGSNWTAPQAPKTGEGFNATALSCVSPSFCVAVGAVANDPSSSAVVFDGTSWSSPVDIDQMRLAEVSCGSVTLCAAIDQFGNALTFDGLSWSGISNPLAFGSSFTYVVSCVSGFCIASGTGTDSYFSTFNGATWSQAVSDTVPAQSISCVTSTFCVAVGQAGWGGNWWLYDGMSWSATLEMDSAPVSHVSCVSTTDCVATDIYGGVRYLYPTDTTTSGSPNQSSVLVGQPVTYMANVSARTETLFGSPTREVTFSAGATKLCASALVRGVASCRADNAPAGTDGISVTYSGDVHYDSSQGSSSITVAKASTRTSVSFPSPISFGSENKARFSATVQTSASLVPTGLVTVKATSTSGVGTIVCTMKLTVVGSGGCSSASNKLPVGAYSIRAIYQGGSDFKTSSSASAPLTVT